MNEQRLVGRQWVNKEDARCLDCKEPFKMNVNIFTQDGHREVRISGICEKCFDSYFEDEDNAY